MSSFHIAYMTKYFIIIEFLIKVAYLKFNVKYKNLAIIKFLIKDINLDINNKNKYGYTSFHKACLILNS